MCRLKYFIAHVWTVIGKIMKRIDIETIASLVSAPIAAVKTLKTGLTTKKKPIENYIWYGGAGSFYNVPTVDLSYSWLYTHQVHPASIRALNDFISYRAKHRCTTTCLPYENLHVVELRRAGSGITSVLINSLKSVDS